MPFYKVNGFNIHAEVHANIVPQNVILLHGNLASNTWWEPAIACWKKKAMGKNFSGSVVAFEWRGCGKSSHPTSESDLRMELLADDVIQVAQKVLSAPAHLLGHSTGGLIALFCLLQSPEAFSKAVLLDSVGARGLKFEKVMYDTFTKMSQDRTVCEQILAATFHSVEKRPEELFQRLVDDAFHIAPVIWHGIPNVLADIDLRKEIQKISHPVLAIHGKEDLLIAPQTSKDTVALLRNGKYLEVPGFGHCLNVENPELFVELSDSFLFS